MIRIRKDCPDCGKPLYFNSGTKTYKCSHCKVDFFREDVEIEDKSTQRVCVGYDDEGKPMFKTYRY